MMLFLYNAHVPFVAIFVLFAAIFAGMNWRRR
jgi:hypothetical protein